MPEGEGTQELRAAPPAPIDSRSPAEKVIQHMDQFNMPWKIFNCQFGRRTRPTAADAAAAASDYR